MSYFEIPMQIPDVRTGDDIIDAVVVDEEVVESKGKSKGCGAKILYGKGALDSYLSGNKSKNVEVRMVYIAFRLFVWGIKK